MACTTAATKLALLLVVATAMAMATAPLAEAALTCGQVSSGIRPCIDYLKKGGAVPNACCGGIRSLNSAAKTTVDRKSACNCLKSAAGSIKGINLSLAAALPGKCGVSVPYKISPSTDCNSVQ